MADRLTEPQKRHLVELWGDGMKTLYWTPRNHGEQRCAWKLKELGLLDGERPISYGHTPYHLNARGREVAGSLAGGQA